MTRTQPCATPTDALGSARALQLAVRLRAAPQSSAIPEGWLVRNDALAAVHDLNSLVISHGDDAARLQALAADWQPGLAHRCVIVDDDDGTRLAPALESAGWLCQRTLLMALTAGRAAAGRDPRVRELSESELDAAQLAYFQSENHGPYASARLPRLLADANAAMRAGTPATRLGAVPTGADEIASICTLFCDVDVNGARVAMVEAVATLREHRGQGLARAVLGAAIAAARAWTADLIVVAADADDWPQLLYASLGFVPIGREWRFTLRASAGVGSAE